MSLAFNDTTTLRGLVQQYEKECGFDQGVVSGSATKLKEFCALANLALDDVTRIAIKASGRWQWDDSNHTGYPIISTNIVSGTRDYAFTVDGAGNIILEVQKVVRANANGVFDEIDSVDQQSDTDMADFYDGQNRTGTPMRYDKTANGIFFDLVPNYNYALGLKMYINREASYFVYTDDVKKAGIPGIFHDFLYKKPALQYARRNSLASYPRLLKEVEKMEGDEAQNLTGTIAEYFSERSKDERGRMTTRVENNH